MDGRLFRGKCADKSSYLPQQTNAERRGIRDGVAITDAGQKERIRVLMIQELRVDESTQEAHFPKQLWLNYS